MATEPEKQLVVFNVRKDVTEFFEYIGRADIMEKFVEVEAARAVPNDNCCTDYTDDGGRMDGSGCSHRRYWLVAVSVRSAAVAIVRLLSVVKGSVALGDVVLNHRCAHKQSPNGVWNIFGGKLPWGPEAIVCDDPNFQGRGNPSSVSEKPNYFVQPSTTVDIAVNCQYL
ncbi:nucleoprotein TPR-like isoform X1 [Cucumis melo var. makuwa]|uniref:Nucleoprotein TPR-like isoform X1 n=1 Tax=Cucumis melo var. makuwa TaxID=1194695 RepID=A0A5A7VLQ1_CUCMM|nr:nucleoprotein TPR-like isoform X1 [Cucumis melo var. makuwa]